MNRYLVLLNEILELLKQASTNDLSVWVRDFRSMVIDLLKLVSH